MEKKILAAASAIILFVLAGLVFAMPGWQKWGEGAQNGTWPAPPWQNKTWQAGNYSQFNSTQVREFRSSVESGDFATAKQLHNKYGFGGPLFGRLNESTFAQYSQIFQLRSQLQNLTGALHQELGLTGAMGHRGRAFMGGYGMGVAMGIRHGKMR